jgi:NAD(P)-dependent dehydrogenase (short-subunit alcohol dehydrogenase family)
MITGQSTLGRMFSLEGKVTIITGGAGGIGTAIARLFGAAGASVVLVDRDEAATTQLAARLASEGIPAEGISLDVADESRVRTAFAGVAAKQGRIDVLVNNAGISIRKSSEELSLDEWRRVFDVNVTGMFVCARTAVQHMPDHAGCSVVNLASIMGFSGGGIYPNPSYQASKGAVVNLTRALAVEWAPRGIRVNAVAPTWVRTAFIGELPANQETMRRVREMTPLGRIAEPEEVAAAALFLCSPAAAMTTGHSLAVDGGYLAQ